MRGDLRHKHHERTRKGKGPRSLATIGCFNTKYDNCFDFWFSTQQSGHRGVQGAEARGLNNEPFGQPLQVLSWAWRGQPGHCTKSVDLDAPLCSPRSRFGFQHNSLPTA
jgi:hypothetical protein